MTNVTGLTITHQTVDDKCYWSDDYAIDHLRNKAKGSNVSNFSTSTEIEEI